MVAFLTKTKANDDFADIVDFLNASSITYSLTINPTVYVSYIKQFWSTTKTKTANNETQIYVKVAGKSVVVTESSIRSVFSLMDDDEEGESLGQPSKPQPTPSPDQSFHEEQVLDLEKAMTAQAKEIAILKKRVKKLEKRKRSRTQGLKLFKMGTSKRRSLDKEDASKHGRNLNARLISEEDDFDVGFDVVRDEGITHVEGDAEQVVIAAAEVVNAGVSVSTVEPKTPPTTTTTLLKDDDVTVAATLVQMSETSKAKSIVFEDVEESAKEQREGKALMVEEDVPPPKKTQK
ncbi:hypothetical protein Tco_0538716 [Tanacetum coccineum]